MATTSSKVSSVELATALGDANALLETSSGVVPTNNIEGVLKIRLEAYYTRLNAADLLENLHNLQTSEEVELQTAKEALAAVQRVQKIVDVVLDVNVQEAPPLGTRDLAKLRMLLSLVFKWGVGRLYSKISQSMPGSLYQSSRKIVDLSSSDIKKDYTLLSDFTSALLALVFPDGVQGRISQTLITTTILSKHVSDTLIPAISLGWLPEKLANSEIPVMHDFRPLVMRLMRLLSPAQAISALAGILSSTDPTPPSHTRKACTTLLTKQLLRPDGIQGLCLAMFFEEEKNGDEVQLDKLEQISKIVNSVPAGMTAEVYFQTIYPRVFQVLSKNPQTNHKRAAAFAIYRALVPEKPTQSSADASKCALGLLQAPLLELGNISINLNPQQPPSTGLQPREALDAIVTLLANTEPSPTLISTLLSPIIPALYSLLFDISKVKTADPQLKESVLGLLKSWGKIVESSEGEAVLWNLIEGGKLWDWKFDLEGNLSKAPMGQKKPGDILMPQDSEGLEDGADIDLNLFETYPDPVHFVETLKLFDRGDLASSLFVMLLDKYHKMKTVPDENSMSVLHKLQIVLQMQKQLSEGTTANILRKPDKLLPFIFHVLSSANVASAPRSAASENMADESDSDDEDAGPQIIGPDDDLIETTITLLLSILEADETLSVATHPILNDIFSLLEPVATKANDTLRPLAREVRLVMTARLAETSGTPKPKNEAEDDAQEIYQRALKLLQDPILPVRAHGLLLLRELLGPTFAKNAINRALVPSILSIFLQSVQDEDSYIFLNAVQGLALLVDHFGKEILQGLLQDYTGKLEGLGTSVLTQQDIDVRTRIGEAMSFVIKKSGSTLGIHVDIVVPPLYAIVRNRDVPTVLRTSSLSLLGACVDTYPLVMLPYVEDLTLGLLDLLQLESVPVKETPRMTSVANNSEGASKEETPTTPSNPPTMDSDPTSKNSKFPPLRRAALHFISLLIKSSTKLMHEESNPDIAAVFPRSAVHKANITLRYLASSDEDNLVRVMAREAVDALEQLHMVALGL